MQVVVVVVAVVVVVVLCLSGGCALAGGGDVQVWMGLERTGEDIQSDLQVLLSACVPLCLSLSLPPIPPHSLAGAERPQGHHRIRLL